MDRLSGHSKSLFPVHGVAKRFKKWLLLRLLEDCADRAAAQDKPDLENAVLNLMDSIEGWCHPKWRLD